MSHIFSLGRAARGASAQLALEALGSVVCAGDQARDGSTGQRAAPRIEPGTRRTRSESHATRPSSLLLSRLSYCHCEDACWQLIRKRGALRSRRCRALINGIASRRAQLARRRENTTVARPLSLAACRPRRARGPQPFSRRRASCGITAGRGRPQPARSHAWPRLSE